VLTCLAPQSAWEGESFVTTERRMAELVADAIEAPTAVAALRAATALRHELDTFERQQVARALAEGDTFASIARELGLSRQAVHRRFRSLLPSAAPAPAAGGVRRVLLYAREEALAAGAARPSSAHVLLATVRATELPAARVLSQAGVTEARVRPLVERLPRRMGDADVVAEAGRFARERLEVEHLLLGALADDAGAAARILRALRVDVGALRAALEARVRQAAPNSGGAP
jgi:ATP-dependent Clp protease ATP-binding subunit ClpA